MSDWSFSNSEMPTIRMTELIKAKEEAYQQGRADAIEEVYRAWLDWNSGKFEEQYFDDVIDKLKEKK